MQSGSRQAQAVGMILIVCASASAELSAQSSPRLVADRTVCQSCRIVIEEVGRIDDAEGPGHLPGMPFGVNSASGGQEIVVLVGGSGPLVYSRQGAFRSEIGRQGSGPGEFLQVVRALSVGGDSLLVLDKANKRMTLVRTSGAVLAMGPFNDHGLSGLVRGRDSTFVINAIVGTPARVGFPLHYVGPDGSPLRSFGAREENPRFRAGEGAWTRSLGAARDGGFWAIDRFQYVIEKYPPQGTFPTAVVRREAPWFRSSPVGYVRPSGTDPGGSFVVGVHEATDSTLWIVSVVGDPRWGSEAGAGRRSASPSASPDLTALHDSMIEVIDPRTWRVISRSRMDHFVIGVTDHGLLVTFEETDRGAEMRILTVRLMTE